MRALVRYAFLKSSRDTSLLSLTVAPTVMVVSLMLGIIGYQMLRGEARYPMTFDARTTPQATALALLQGSTFGAVVMAAIAGFWLFRTEIGNHSIGTMVIAIRARAISAVATLHGAIIGTSAFLLSLAMIVLFTAHVPAPAPRLVFMIGCTAVAAAAWGILLATISPESAMALPVIAGAMMMLFFAASASPEKLVAGSVTLTSLFVLTAAVLMERRCAA